MIGPHLCLSAIGGLMAVMLLSGCVSSSQQQNTQVVESPRERACDRVRAATLLGPTRSGSFGEGVANAEAAYANCMAGLPVTPARRPTTMTCQRGFHGSITCTGS
jgi:hypothetical protein